MADSFKDAPEDSTVRFTSFRAECYSVHVDGSGAWIGEWRNSADAAQQDADAHDKSHHEGQSHARVEFK